MTLILHPQTDALAIPIAQDTFITGPYNVSIDGRATTSVDYTWAVPTGSLYVDPAGGAYVPSGSGVSDGLAWVGISRYSYALQGTYMPSSDAATATMGLMYGYGVADHSRFYGVINNRLVVQVLNYSGSPIGNQLYDIRGAGLADGVPFTLAVLKDRWYSRFYLNGIVRLEINDVGMYDDGITQFGGIYLANTTGKCTEFTYNELSLVAEKERGEFIIPFYAIAQNCSESPRTPIYCPAEAYSLFAQSSGSLTSDARLDFYENEVLIPALTVTLTPSSGSLVVDYSASPVDIGDGGLGYFTMRVATLDDNDYGITASIEAIPRVMQINLNDITFSGTIPTPHTYRLVEMGTSDVIVGLGGKYPRLNTAFVDQTDAQFLVPVGTVSLDGDTLGLSGAVVTNIQSGNFVAVLHWDTPSSGSNAFVGLMFNCTAAAQGNAAIINWDSSGSATFQYVTIQGQTIGAVVYSAPLADGSFLGGNILVGRYGDYAHTCVRGTSETDTILAEFTTFSPGGAPYTGISGSGIGDIFGITFEVYLGEPHAIIRGSMQSYDNLGANDNDAGDANMTVPWILEHRELVDGANERYAWDGHIHSQDPITTGVLSASQFKTGTQGGVLDTLILTPTLTAPRNEPIYHEYGLVKPLYLILPEAL